MVQTSVTSDNSSTTRLRLLTGFGALCLSSALVGPHVLAQLQLAEIDATRDTMATVSGALEAWADDHGGRFPTTGESVRALSDDSADQDRRWNGPYIETPTVDAWGREFLYWSPGNRNRDSFDLSSAGPDGVFGNSDDITNW